MQDGRLIYEVEDLKIEQKTDYEYGDIISTHVNLALLTTAWEQANQITGKDLSIQEMRRWYHDRSVSSTES